MPIPTSKCRIHHRAELDVERARLVPPADAGPGAHGPGPTEVWSFFARQPVRKVE